MKQCELQNMITVSLPAAHAATNPFPAQFACAAVEMRAARPPSLAGVVLCGLGGLAQCTAMVTHAALPTSSPARGGRRAQVVDSPNFIEQYQSRDDIFNRPDLVREQARHSLSTSLSMSLLSPPPLLSLSLLSLLLLLLSLSLSFPLPPSVSRSLARSLAPILSLAPSPYPSPSLSLPPPPLLPLPLPPPPLTLSIGPSIVFICLSGRLSVSASLFPHPSQPCLW